MRKRTRGRKQNKRSIVASIQDGHYTLEQAVRILHLPPSTIKQWMKAFEQDVPAIG